MSGDPSADGPTGIERGRRFDPRPRNVRAAREFVAAVLAAEGFRGDVDTVLLLASELATNAIRHAATPFEVLVDAGPDAVKVAVVDEDASRRPQVRSPRPEDTHGRGLMIVQNLSVRWGSDRVGATHKSVWFTLN